jgi:hypothetical protein
MNTTKKPIPPIVQLGSWVLALFVFAVGFWHTHLGLKEMKPFGSEWGGLVIASIVLLLLLITYWFAVNGRKSALFFYILCGLIFFICNVNYFYPSYLARQLVKEEATKLYDTTQNYSNTAQAVLKSKGYGKNGHQEHDDYAKLQNLKRNIVSEIKGMGGEGANARRYINEFNKILLSYKGNIVNYSGNTSNEKLAEYYERGLSDQINWLLESIAGKGGNLADASNFLVGVHQLDTIRKKYTPLLKDSIIPDNSTIALEEVKTNKQIKILQKLVSGINEATSKINKSSNKEIFKKLEEAQTRNLGTIAHTFKSVKERSNKVDTWAIIILCLFIDLVVPLAIYLLIKKSDDDSTETERKTKLRPSTI